jgi:amidase
MDHIKRIGKNFPDTLDKYGMDVIIGPADSGFSKYSAATGTSAMPLSISDLTNF